MNTRTALIAMLSTLMLTACFDLAEGKEDAEEEGGRGGPIEGDIIAIGDSIFEWNVDDDASIPDVVGAELGVTVANRAISGTWLTQGEDAIPKQYVSRDWRAVIMDGGANDLNDECGCGDCDDLIDEMVSADGRRGVLPSFVDEASADGVPVVFWGYYEVPDSADHGFDRCNDVVDVLGARLTALAAADDGFYFVDGREQVSATDLQYFDDDHAHPSVAGSRVVGEQIARAIGDLGL